MLSPENGHQPVRIWQLVGFQAMGVITNIINGGLEYGKGPEGDEIQANKDRIGFYERYCGLYGIDPGDNLDCYYQKPFGSGPLTL